MALITMPSSPAFTTSEWGMRRGVAVSTSPFTGKHQTFKSARATWYAVLSLPPMKREQAAEWQAFFLSLEGRSNTFLLGDPDAKTIRGNAESASVGASGAIGDSVVNLTLGSGKTLNKGSYIQLNTGANARLHMIVDDNTGNGTCAIQPPLKAAITTSTPVDLTSAQGVFRMDSNDLTWSANELSLYGIPFSFTEVV